MSTLRKHIATQDGIALPVAIMVLFIVLTLTAAAVAVSVQTSSTTQRDNNVKAALAAAEAGLETATYRLDILHPKETGEKNCVGRETVEAPSLTGGYCKEVKEELGNKASYSYWTSEALGSSASCVGQNITSQESLTQRCVVAEGVFNGVKRRVSQRIAAFVAKPLFPVHGVTGLKKVSMSNNTIDKGSAGSNGEIEVSNNGNVSEVCELGPSGKVKLSNNAKCTAVKQRTTAEGPLTLGAVEPGNSAEKCTIVAGKVTSGNSDCLITKYLENPTKPTEPYDTAEKVTFNEATRQA